MRQGYTIGIIVRLLAAVHKLAIAAVHSVKVGGQLRLPDGLLPVAAHCVPLPDGPSAMSLAGHTGKAGFIERAARGCRMHLHHAWMAGACTARVMDVPREGR